MKTPESGRWHRTSPLAALFFFGQLLQSIAKNAVQTFAPLFAFLIAYEGNLANKVVIAVVGFFTVTISISLLRYWFFRYRISDDSILIRQGVVKKKQLDIRFNRIQGINTQQNIVFRALGLVTVTFDTAGSSANEGNLPAISRGFADSLRAKIGKNEQLTDAGEEKRAAPEQLLLQLDWRDMIRIGLADRRVLVLLAFMGPFFERLGDNIDTVITNYIERTAGDIASLGVATGSAILFAIVLGFLLVFALVSIAFAFFRYHNFTLSLAGRSLRAQSGLLTRHEHSMDLDKIQTLRVRQGILLRYLRRFRLLAKQATSANRSKGKNFVVPIIDLKAAENILDISNAPEAGRLTLNPDDIRFVRISGQYLRTRIMFIGAIPAILITAVTWPQAGPSALLFMLWLPVAALMFWQLWRRYGYMHDDDGLARRTGLYGYRVDAFLFRKVQRVTIKQSRRQHRRSLATLKIFLASGSVRLPYIDHATACRLRDYMLYKVESSQKAWH